MRGAAERVGADEDAACCPAAAPRWAGACAVDAGFTSSTGADFAVGAPPAAVASAAWYSASYLALVAAMRFSWSWRRASSESSHSVRSLSSLARSSAEIARGTFALSTVADPAATGCFARLPCAARTGCRPRTAASSDDAGALTCARDKLRSVVTAKSSAMAAMKRRPTTTSAARRPRGRPAPMGIFRSAAAFREVDIETK